MRSSYGPLTLLSIPRVDRGSTKLYPSDRSTIVESDAFKQGLACHEFLGSTIMGITSWGGGGGEAARLPAYQSRQASRQHRERGRELGQAEKWAIIRQSTRLSIARINQATLELWRITLHR